MQAEQTTWHQPIDASEDFRLKAPLTWRIIGSINERRDHQKPSRQETLEERLLARFDAFDARFDSIDARLEKLELRSYDTKPIWEKALAAIAETRSEMNVRLEAIETRIGTIETRVESIETKVDALDARVDALESQVAGLRADHAIMRSELLDTQRDFKRTLTRLLENLVSFLTDTRELMQDNDARLKLLESKLA